MVSRTAAAAAALGSAALTVAALSGGAASAAPVASSAPADTAVHVTSARTATDQVTTRHIVTKQGAKRTVTTFRMVRSTGVVKAGCLPRARARVSVTSGGPVDVMRVYAIGLPKKTDFDFFVLTQPDLPFGLSWYQGDLESDRYGHARATYVGRFNEETFSVGVGTPAAPVRHTSPFQDASVSPATAPVHQYHLGFWFNSPADSAAAGCGNAVTPFNGEHNAGTQAMSTRHFAALNGPLGRIKS